MAEQEQKFSKSMSNKRTENQGLAVLCADLRFQAPDSATKVRILELLPIKGEFGPKTFDAIMTLEPAEPITVANVADYMDHITLIEMKTTKKPIQNRALNRFFFGATEREYAMAKALGERYLFAFLVLNDDNDYGHPFFELLSLASVEERTRGKRLQYQVNFHSDMTHDTAADERWAVETVLGDAAETEPPYDFDEPI